MRNLFIDNQFCFTNFIVFKEGVKIEDGVIKIQI